MNTDELRHIRVSMINSVNDTRNNLQQKCVQQKHSQSRALRSREITWCPVDINIANRTHMIGLVGGRVL